MRFAKSWVVGLATIGGCQNPQFDAVPHYATISSAASDNGVVVELSRPTFRAGDSVTVSVTATNSSSRTLAFHSIGCPIWFEVLRGAVVV